MKYILLFIAGFAFQFACGQFAQWLCDRMGKECKNDPA